MTSRRDRDSQPTGGFDNAGDGASGSGGTGFGNASGPVPPPPTVPTGGGIAPQGEREAVTMDECPGAVAADVAERLAAADLPAAQMGWLYPYDRTVFPRGLKAPVLQWQAPPSAAGAVMIHLRSMLLDYRVCLPLAEPMRVALPDAAWELAGRQSLGRGDPLSVEVAIDVGGQAQRMPPLSLTFALADIKGAIYYNTYGSLLANQMGIIGGVVMRVLPGRDEPEVFLSAANPVADCVGCHAVSADGSRMVAEVHGQPGLFEGPSASFDLTAVGTGSNPPPIVNNLRRAGFAALYPDGSVYVTTARVAPGPIGAIAGTPPGNVPGTFGPEQAKLYDTNNGAELTGSGLEPWAYMPMFSVDGSQLVYTKMDMSGAAGGRTLSVADFDPAANTFSNPRDIFSDPAQFVGWPFFLPEVVQEADELVVPTGKRVIFALGAMPDFATQEQPVGLSPHPSDLWWVDVQSGTAAPLNRANGLDASGAVTLPYGERDAHKNYIPTVSPVSAGGYFWLFFTSKRNYGNLFIADPPEVRAEAKKIWVSAIDIDAAPGSDPSHPAFFLPGQELESGNIRAFAALEPCRDNAAACESGVECCCGFCREGECGCPEGCANVDDRCETAADCCSESARCIGGFCALVVD